MEKMPDRIYCSKRIIDSEKYHAAFHPKNPVILSKNTASSK